MKHPVVNIGSAPDDGMGDSLRTAFVKINAALEELGARYAVPIEWINVGGKPNSGSGDNLSIGYVKVSTNLDRLSRKSGIDLEPLHPKIIEKSQDIPLPAKVWWRFWKSPQDDRFSSLNLFYPFSRDVFIQINKNFAILDRAP